MAPRPPAAVPATAQGFDEYFGIPYSNDMDMLPVPGATTIGGEDPKKRARIMDPRIEYWNVPLMRGAAVLERPADQRTITRRYTEEAVRFIRGNASRPFFLYLCHSMPRVTAHDPPLLYDLDHDPGERYDVGARHPEALARIERLAAEHAMTVAAVENQVEKRAP